VDVLDVRDTVDGLILLAKRGEMGKIYNLSSGKGYTIKQLLDLMISLSQSKVEIQIDPTRFRPKDYGALVGDNSRLRQLGWAAHVPIETTLRDIMDFWRKEFKTDSLARKELTD
jgi:GDP-4-dehydro-6-deoxy-D-mannose reductase